MRVLDDLRTNTDNSSVLAGARLVVLSDRGGGEEAQHSKQDSEE